MSATMRRDTRNAFVTAMPVLTPLYSSNCESWQIATEGELICGRHSDCQIVISDESIEEQHCVFNFRPGALTIRRIDGRIWLNDLPLTREESLAVGDILTLGPFSFRIESEPRPASIQGQGNRSQHSPDAQTSVNSGAISSPAPGMPGDAAQPRAVMTAAIDERLAAIESKTRLLEQQEKQTRELHNLVQERERTLAERIRTLDDRANFLNELKASLDCDQSDLKALKQNLQKQQEEVERRIRLVADRESQLQSHVESSALTYSQLEQTRAELNARSESLTLRESAVSSKQSELAQLAAAVEQQVSRNASEANEQKAREEALAARESELQRANAALAKRESATAEAAQAAEETHANLNKLQQEATARLQLAEDRLREAETRCRDLASMEERISEQAARLEVENEEQQKTTDDIGRLRAELQEQQKANDELAAHLTLKAQELETQAAELAAEKLEIAEENAQNSTRSVGQLAELAVEREAATQARQEALQALEDVRLRSAEISDQQAKLSLWQAELESRHTELAVRVVSLKEAIKGARFTVDNHAATNESGADSLAEQTQRIQTEWETLAQRQAEVAASEARVAELEQAAREALTRAESSAAGIDEKSVSLQTEWETLAQRQAEVAASEARVAELEQAAREALTRAESSAAGIDEKSVSLQTEWETLAQRQAEVAASEVRVAELEQAAREAHLKTEADAAAIMEQKQTVDEELQRLSKRQTELEAVEARVKQLEAAAHTELKKAEAEREALRTSHKDMICEKNSLMQMSQDLQSRASGLAEREAIVVNQTDELRSKFQALNQQDAALEKRDAELNLRAAELHNRVTRFKADMEEARSGNASGLNSVQTFTEAVPNSDDADQLKSLSEVIETSRSELASVTSERDALMVAVRELQQAMISAREDVEEAKRIRDRASNQDQSIDSLYQTIEERSSQLQIMECKWRQAEEAVAGMQAQLEELRAQVAAAPVATSALETVGDFTAENDGESELLGQLQTLRAELARSASGNPERQEEYDRALTERDGLISEFRDEIRSLKREVPSINAEVGHRDVVSPIEVDELRARISRSEEVLRDRDDLIRELRARLAKAAEASTAEAVNSESISVSDLQAEARDLDRRATLLDNREEELRERLRKVSQTEEEVEGQRRQLLDARQQLELARAEIQVAMKQHSSQTSGRTQDETSRVSASARYENGAGTSSAIFGDDSHSGRSLEEVDAADISPDSSTTDLRTELANLFGVKRPAPESVPPTVEFPDVSEPGGEKNAVELRFGDNAMEIIKSAPPTIESDDSSREENSDDFVRDYMEQLLSRSRKSAGNSLPTELQQPNKEKVSVDDSKKADTKPGQKPAPKVKSFIDQYMSGGFGDLTGDGSMAASMPVEATEESLPDSIREEPVVPRIKVDRAKLRENMDSFRSLSTQSVENALVNHAIRQEKNNINGRIMVTFVMVTMSIFLAIANAKGIINHPSLIWVSLVGAIGSGAELLRKWYSVRDRCKNALQPEGKLPFSTGPVSSQLALEPQDRQPMELVPTANDVPANDVPANDVPANDAPAIDALAIDAPGDQEAPNKEFVPRKRTPAIIEEPDEPEYFEL